MWNYLTEKFMTEYFLYGTALGGYMDGQAVFNLLSETFMLSDDEKAFAQDLINNENVCDIKTESDYMRYLRSKKYFALTGISTDIGCDEDIAITLKGAAIDKAKNINCSFVSTPTRLKIEENLTAGATGGSITAMRLMGVTLSEGIFFTQNKEEGLRYLRMAASWNDVPSLFYALRYDGTHTRRYAGKLGFLLKNASHGEILPVIEGRYGHYEYGENKEAKLLEKLFQLNMLQRETYSPPHIRALFSKVISYKDKEKLLYTAGKDYLSLVGDLPLKLGEKGICGFDFSVFKNIPAKDKPECGRIIACLNNSDLRKTPIYRPICLSSDCKYLLQTYAEAITQSAAGAHIEYICVDELNISQFDHNKNNVFIRSCDEDKENIYFMFFMGDISDMVAEQAKAFLKSDARSHFRLNMPNINIDLSHVLPICFCDLQNEKQLRGICDVIRLADCTDSEKSQMLQHMIENEAFLYGVPEIEIQEGLKKKLLSLSVDDMVKELDTEVSLNRRKGVKLVLTEENFASDRTANGNYYGFGGFRNENN